MQYFTSNKSITSAKRQTYTGSKSAYSAVSALAGVGCYFKPLTEEQSSANSIQYGYGFSLIVEPNIDIREGDKLTIESIEYTVRGIVLHDRGTYTQYLRCLLLKPQQS